MQLNPNYITVFCCLVRCCLLCLYAVTVKISTLTLTQISLQSKKDKNFEYHKNITKQDIKCEHY